MKEVTIKDMPHSIESMSRDTGGIAKYDTLEQCKESYIHAEELYESQKENVVSVIRATALRSAKELIYGGLWRQPAKQCPQEFNDRWKGFLSDLDLLKPNGASKAQVSLLLQFARVKEASDLKGIKTVIPNAEQLRILSKSTKTDIDSAILYDKLAEKYNESKPFASAVKVEAAIKAFKAMPPKPESKPEPKEKTEKAPKKKKVEKVYLRHIFIEEVGEQPEHGMNAQGQAIDIYKSLPDVTETEWKQWYRKVSRLLHPDHGGDDKDMSILASLNKMVTTPFKEAEKTKQYSQWDSDYEQWKADHGYKNDFIDEDEL